MTMNNALVIALGVGLIAGILIGTRVARRSLKDEPIYGGSLSAALHWLACAAFTGGLPAGLVDIILGRNIVNGILLALSFVAVSFISLVLFAAVEHGPRAAALVSDQGWTAEKAKSSGL